MSESTQGVLTKNNKREYYRLLIGLACGAIHFLIALKLRPELNIYSNRVYSFLLGTIPSFLAAFGLYFLVSFFIKKKRLGILLGVYLGVLLQELQQINYNINESGIVGRTFDYYDIAFITLGALTAFLIEKKMRKI